MSSNSDRESMSSVDNAWLRMDRPYNHMTINGVIVLADRLDLERLKQHIETRMLIYKRFKQRPVYHSTGAYWETDTHFELSSHIRRVGLPGARGKEELKEFVSNLVSTPWTRPSRCGISIWWRIIAAAVRSSCAGIIVMPMGSP